MTLHQSAAGATKWMGSALAITAISRFARNVILSRMLLPADFGIGATFTLTLTFFELISNLGPQKQLVQAEEGGLQHWQSVTHTVLFLRSSLMALAIFCGAGWIASWFDIPDAVNAMRCLAIIPILRGLEHCDTYRFQRDLQTMRLAVNQAAPAIFGLAIAPLCGWYFGDYRAFLALAILMSLVQTTSSHLLAIRPYRFGASRDIASRIFVFGLPLLANGMLLFLIFHGERFLIGKFFGMTLLGGYSVILGLALAPTTMIANLHGSVALPIFSRRQSDRRAFERAFVSSSQIMCLFAGLLSIGFVVAGEWMIGTIYGQSYLGAIAMANWVALACSVRIARATLATSAIALGDTANAPLSNLIRVATFAASFFIAWRHGSLVAIAQFAFLGELVAYLVSAIMLRRRHGLRTEIHVGYLMAMYGFTFVAWLISRIVSGGGGLVLGWREWTAPALACVCMAATLLFAMIQWHEFRGVVISFSGRSRLGVRAGGSS